MSPKMNLQKAEHVKTNSGKKDPSTAVKESPVTSSLGSPWPVNPWRLEKWAMEVSLYVGPTPLFFSRPLLLSDV